MMAILILQGKLCGKILIWKKRVRGHRCVVVIIIGNSVITCSKLIIETLEQGVKYVQS